MSLLSKINPFGSIDLAKDIVSGSKELLDDAFFTQEERSQMSAKLNDWYLKYLNATQPQNISRRIIVCMVTALWGLLIMLGVGLHLGGSDKSDFVFNVLKDIVNPPFMILMAFYFVTHAVRGFKKGE